MGPAKAAVKKAPATKKKAVPVKKVATKKAVVKKAAPARKAVPVNKIAAKKVAAKNVAAKKAVAKKAVAKKATAARTLPPVVSTPAVVPVALREPKGRSNRRVGVIAAVVAFALLAGGVAAYALIRDTAPSKAEFLADADELCRPANGPVAAIVKPTSYPELATAAGTVVTTTTSQIEQLTKIKHPSGADGRAFTPTLTALTTTNAEAKKLQDAATRKDDPATAQAANNMSNAFLDANEKAKKYGFTSCATGMTPGLVSLVGGAGAVVKTGFVAKADGACRATSRQLDEIREPVGDHRDVARFLSEAIDSYNKLLVQLRAATVPPGDETTVSEMLEAADKANAKLGEIRDAASGDDLARFTAAEKEGSTLATAADAKFDAYGLAICGSNFGDA